MNTVKRTPIHPGRILKEIYLDELGITITSFANDIGVSRKSVSAIINGGKSITPEMALRISRALSTTPELWLNLQNKYALAQAESRIRKKIDVISPIFLHA